MINNTVDVRCRMEFIGNVVVIMVAASAVGRVAYYIAYGKEGGAEALPKRK